MILRNQLLYIHFKRFLSFRETRNLVRFFIIFGMTTKLNYKTERLLFANT